MPKEVIAGHRKVKGGYFSIGANTQGGYDYQLHDDHAFIRFNGIPNYYGSLSFNPESEDYLDVENINSLKALLEIVTPLSILEILRILA